MNGVIHVDRADLVGVATHYGIDCLRIKSRWGRYSVKLFLSPVKMLVDYDKLLPNEQCTCNSERGLEAVYTQTID